MNFFFIIMFEVFLRKKKIEEFAKEEISSGTVLKTVFISILILQIIVFVLSATNIIETNFTITELAIGAVIGTITAFVLIIIGEFIWSGIEYLFAKLVKGTGSFGQFFWKMLYLYAPFILLGGLESTLSNGFNETTIGIIFGIIGLILIIYSLYLSYGLIKNYFNLSTGKALTVIIAPIVLIIILIVILIAILGAWFLTQITQVGTAQGLATLFNQ